MAAALGRPSASNEKIAGDEFARLQAALDRVGNPKEFLAPLLADAVFKSPPQHGSFAMTYRTLSLYASRGTSYLLRTLGLMFAAASGLIIALAALNSLLRPDHAGLFRIGEDEYQVRVMGFGDMGGEQLLAPWMAIVLIAIGATLLWWTARRVRRMLLELIAQTA